VRDDPVKDAAQDAAEDVPGDAKDERCSSWHASSSTAPHAFLGRQKDEHVKDVAQDVAEGVAEDVPQDVAQELAFGARAARRRNLCAAHAEIGAQLGSSVAFGSGCGEARPGVPRPGVPRKAPLCLYARIRLILRRRIRCDTARAAALRLSTKDKLTTPKAHGG